MTTQLTSTSSCLLVCMGNKNVVLGRKMFIPCETLKEASDIITKQITDSEVGSSCFYSIDNIGEILHPTKGKIAYVSYNGRVWVSEGVEVKNLNTNDIN